MSLPDRYLNPEAFRNQIIAPFGQRVLYEKSVPCPCRNPATGDFSRNCPLLLAGDCDGAAVYREQTLPPRAKVYFDRAKKTIDDSEMGLITVGDLMAYSMPDWVPLERNDRLVILDWYLEVRETQQRGAETTDVLIQRYPFAIDSISWLNGANWVDATIATPFQLEANPNVDHDATLINGETRVGSIQWSADGKSPEEGQNYTVIYRYRPTVYVSGTSFMPSRASVVPKPGADPTARYGLPIRALMTYQSPQRNNG